MLNDIAWEIIDHWITKEYGGDEDALRDEVGNLNDYAYRIANAIEMHDIDTADIKHCASLLEMHL